MIGLQSVDMASEGSSTPQHVGTAPSAESNYQHVGEILTVMSTSLITAPAAIDHGWIAIPVL